MASCIQCGRKLPPLSLGKKRCQWCAQHEAAQRGEEHEDARQVVIPPPWVDGSSNRIGFTHILFGINVAVFLAMALAGGGISEPSVQQLVAWGADWGPLTLGGEWWRFFTYMFLHGGILHIAFNMWCLWDLGKLCESLYGRWTFAAIYLISGVGGGVASVAWNPGGVSVGASGAIFGLAGALIAAFYLGEFSAPRLFIQSRLRSLLVFAGYNLIFGAVSGRTDNAAHIGGLAAGLALGALIARVAPHPEDWPRRFAVLLAMALLVAGGAFWLGRSHGYLMHTGRGSDFLDQNKNDQAIAELEKAVEQRPDYVPAHFGLAQAYSNKSQFSQAEAELKKILELQPRNGAAHNALGFMYLEEKRGEEAKAEFARLLAADQNNAEAHLGMGMALAGEQDDQTAIEHFMTAIRLQPQTQGAYSGLGHSYGRLKRYDEAVAAYQKKQETEGDDYETELALADAYQAKGMQPQAEAARRKAEQLRSRK